MSTPISHQLIKIINNDTLVKKIKQDALLRLRPKIWYLTDQIKTLFDQKIPINIYDVTAFIDAAYNPLYGHRIPYSPAHFFEQWKSDLNRRESFKTKYGKEIVYFIDAYAAGNTSSAAEKQVLDNIQANQELVLSKCVSPVTKFNEALAIYNKWTAKTRNRVSILSMRFNSSSQNMPFSDSYSVPASVPDTSELALESG